MPTLDDLMTDEQIAQRKIFIKHERLLATMLDTWPGLLSIKDVTKEPWKVVYMNDKMLEVTRKDFGDYYERSLSEILDVDQEALHAEDQQVIDADFGILHEFVGPGIHNEIWRRQRFKFEDGDKLYTVVSMKRVDDEG